MKKVALVTFGIADGYCHKGSQRLINNGPELFAKVVDIVSNSGAGLGAYVAVNNPADTETNVNVYKQIPHQKIINFKLCTDQLLHVNNELSITDHHGDIMLFNGNQFDFIVRPQDYDIHICGIDINGIFIDAIDSFLRLGFSVTVYSDVIKPFSKKTINHIKNSQVKFVSAKSVCLK